jgi:hypothetical protein
MKQIILFRNIFLFLLLDCAMTPYAGAQKNDCIFKEPIFKIDFGTERNSPDINTDYLPYYRRVSTSCPMDGHYSYSSFTRHCNDDDWFTLNEDHTPGDEDGKMMVVNASEIGGIFFTATINGLKENTRYEFGACMMNLCRIGGHCPILPPSILIFLKTPAGRLVGQFQTGELPQEYEPDWKRYAGFFGTGAKETTLLLTMDDVTLGGCGNDFALDDIIIRECIKPQPPVTEKPKPVTKQEKKTETPPKPVIKKETVKQPIVKTNDKVPVIEKSKPDTLINTKILPKQKSVIVPVPPILLSRTNPVIKQFSVDAGELQINLYDNGEIDGDTVSVYHNNELIVSKARLSQKPISFRVNIDADHPHHELIMVANNLGAIPPNTSVMIITANEKRYQVFISSTEQKNAKVVFDLRE